MLGNNKCVNCGGENTYNPEKGLVCCDRCGSSFPVKERKRRVIKRQYTSMYSPEENKQETIKYFCDTCGAQSVVGDDGEIKRCASCGNTSIRKEQSVMVVPDAIIPFEISRRKAGDIFKKWVHSRKFAPSDLKQMAKLEKITGLYTPVWNLNYKTIYTYTGMGIKVKTNSDGKYETVEYPIYKEREDVFEDVLKTASSRITNNFLDGLGEYDFNKLRPFSTDYLLGFVGIDTDLNLHDVYNDIVETTSKQNEKKTRSYLKTEYNQVEAMSYRTRFLDVYFNYTYLPVWANHYIYKGKEYHCYINGQTGVATGKAPKSFWKVAGLIGGIVAGVALGILAICLII